MNNMKQNCGRIIVRPFFMYAPGIGAMEGQSREEIKSEVKCKIVPLLIVSSNNLIPIDIALKWITADHNLICVGQTRLKADDHTPN